MSFPQGFGGRFAGNARTGGMMCQMLLYSEIPLMNSLKQPDQEFPVWLSFVRDKGASVAPYSSFSAATSIVAPYFARSFGFSILPVGLRGTSAKMIFLGLLYLGSFRQKLFTCSSVQV